MNGERPTILIVDDAPENLDILKALLEDDYNVKAAPGGEVALKIVRSGKPPDLILLDIIMPGMDGFQVYHELRKDSSTAEIPVIFVSGNMSDDKKFDELEGSPMKLEKPVIPQLLRETIDRIFS